MKRAGRILSLLVVTLMLCTTVCFAAPADSAGTPGTFQLLDEYPRNGATGAAMENVGVKLYFDTEFTEEILKDINDGAFEMTDPDGKKFPLMVLYTPKEDIKEEGVKGIILVLLDNTGDNKDVKVASNTEYTLKISKDLVDDNGNTLGTDKTVTFRTMNQQANTMINIGMMVVMYGGIMFFTMRSMKKGDKEGSERQRDEKVNPYKEAKRTGKSVEEIVEKDQKDKAKRAAKLAKQQAEEEEYEEEDNGNYKVKGPRPISAGGGRYITGRKAEAEARKAEAEARAARAKKKSKGKKK